MTEVSLASVNPTTAETELKMPWVEPAFEEFSIEITQNGSTHLNFADGFSDYS